MRELFILGAGEIGKRLSDHLGSNWNTVFVDSNIHVQLDCPKNIISLEEYLNNYSNAFIVIAHLHEEDSIAVLQKNNVTNYFIHCELPGEFKEPYVREYLKSYVTSYLGKRKDYVLYGLGLYSIVVDDWIYRQFGIHPYILVQKNISKTLIEKITNRYDGLKLVYDIHKLDKINEIGVCLDNCIELEQQEEFGQYQLTDLFDCTDRIKEYYNPKIEQFYNIHKGKRCFIVATGPSLKIEDLNTLKANQEICISMNSIFHAFDETEWRPDYYVMSDYKGFSMYEKQLDSLPVKAKFLGDNSEIFWKTSHDEHAYRYHQHYEYCYDRLPKFSDDFSKRSYTAGTVTYTCMQLAAYMGFEKIYLLGVDFTGSSKAVSKYRHFYMEKEMTAVNYTEVVKAGYNKAKQYAQEYGIEIYNATRGGELEVFERVDFDTLFNI